MLSVAEGALFADKSLVGIGISGDGDTANIGLSQFKHLVRRNVPMVYIVENNGVYGLTKGQFSATAEKGLTLKRQGENPYLPVDIALEAIAANASLARSFVYN
jgi:2-oxoglutarate ferredoxin oxidoreductase subunit beta